MTGMILGSPRYMSPEQVIGSQLDHRSDIFSLGVVLYESLTGVAPFDGDNVNAIMYATVNTTQSTPSSHNRAIPQMLDLIVAKALAKDVESRYHDARQMAADLREVWKQLLGNKTASGLQITQPLRSIAAGVAANVSNSVGSGKASGSANQSETNRDASSASARHIGTPGEATMATGSATSVVSADQRANLNAQAEDARKLSLAQGFDSSEAMVKLLSQTNQVEEFKDYVTATQKMRAFKIKESAERLQANNAAAAASAAGTQLDSIIGNGEPSADMRNGGSSSKSSGKKASTKLKMNKGTAGDTHMAATTLGIVMVAALVIIVFALWLVMR
jgi:eukaryotic-like serine/threonine-protein kinase